MQYDAKFVELLQSVRVTSPFDDTFYKEVDSNRLSKFNKNHRWRKLPVEFKGDLMEIGSDMYVRVKGTTLYLHMYMRDETTLAINCHYLATDTLETFRIFNYFIGAGIEYAEPLKQSIYFNGFYHDCISDVNPLFERLERFAVRMINSSVWKLNDHYIKLGLFNDQIASSTNFINHSKDYAKAMCTLIRIMDVQVLEEWEGLYEAVVNELL